jgi:hypothetical protein
MKQPRSHSARTSLGIGYQFDAWNHGFVGRVAINLMPRTMVSKHIFGLCTDMRPRERLQLCQNVARVSPGGVKVWDLGLGAFTHKTLCRVRVASFP